MMNLTLDRASDIPLYRQVVSQIRELIQMGTLAPGERLPTVREVAAELGLTRLTVHSAYTELQAQGLTESFVGRGTFVAAHAARPGAEPYRHAQQAPTPTPWLSQGLLADLVRTKEEPLTCSFAQAYPAPETYPLRDFERALRAALSDPSALSYGPLQGEASLREQISRLLLERDISVAPEHVLITAGAQQAIDITLRALTTPTDTVLVEEPTYPGVIELAAQRGQRVVGIPMDEAGLSIAALEEACALYKPRLLYTIPTHHNPTGISLAADRRSALLRVASAYDLLIVEDDTYGFLPFAERAQPPLKASDDDGRVIYVLSFAKILLPTLRLGALVASPQHLPRLAATKQANDLVCSSLLQLALAHYLRRGQLVGHLRQTRALYRIRAQALLAALERYTSMCSWTRPDGGLSLWLALPEGVAEEDVYREALTRGVGVARGQAFFLQPRRSGYLRLSFGAHTPEQIEQGVELLGEIIQRQQRRRAQIVARAGQHGRPLV